MKPGYYWGRLKGDPVPMEPCKVQDDETVWFFMDEFHPMSVARLEFGPEIIPPTEERIEAEKLSFEQWDRHQREIWAAKGEAMFRRWKEDTASRKPPIEFKAAVGHSVDEWIRIEFPEGNAYLLRVSEVVEEKQKP